MGEGSNKSSHGHWHLLQCHSQCLWKATRCKGRTHDSSLSSDHWNHQMWRSPIEVTMNHLIHASVWSIITVCNPRPRISSVYFVGGLLKDDIYTKHDLFGKHNVKTPFLVGSCVDVFSSLTILWHPVGLAKANQSDPTFVKTSFPSRGSLWTMGLTNLMNSRWMQAW